ncbi:Hypothetical predicted protein [Pelobates cultripes]|uniref:Uncharacterized protein n=1 Tax=Pelobates cultripes TaxID=61616 RepID=A0AAD1WBB5_PELCU|nr:Hypothetical predicted protein [Pelobates cultripes]
MDAYRTSKYPPTKLIHYQLPDNQLAEMGKRTYGTSTPHFLRSAIPSTRPNQ